MDWSKLFPILGTPYVPQVDVESQNYWQPRVGVVQPLPHGFELRGEYQMRPGQLTPEDWRATLGFRRQF
jgi:hypothetical protein